MYDVYCILYMQMVTIPGILQKPYELQYEGTINMLYLLDYLYYYYTNATAKIL